MKNKQEYYLNTKRYLKNGNRLAIFGREIDGELETFRLECSKLDNFKKDVAKDVYNIYLYKSAKEWRGYFNRFHPKIERIVIEEGNTARYTFERYCSLFYSKHIDYIPFWVGDRDKILQIEYLRNNNEYLTIGQPKWIKK